MDTLAFTLTALTLVIAVGTMMLVYLASSRRAEKQNWRLHRSENAHGEYRKLNRLVSVIKRSDYLRSDQRDLNVVVEPFSMHVGQTEFERLNAIIQSNPYIEPHTCDAWAQVAVCRISRYPSGIQVVDISRVAFDNFAGDVSATLDALDHVLRSAGPVYARLDSKHD